MSKRRIHPTDHDRSELAGLVLQATGPIAADYSNALVQGTEMHVIDGITLEGEILDLDPEGKPRRDLAGRLKTRPWRGPLPHGHPWRTEPKLHNSAQTTNHKES